MNTRRSGSDGRLSSDCHPSSSSRRTVPPEAIDRSVMSPGGSPLWQFGGRWIQTDSEIPCEGLRREAGHEIARYGHRPLVIGGPTALSLTEDALRESFLEAKLEAVFVPWSGGCSVNAANRLLDGAGCGAPGACGDTAGGFDVIVGVGGGRIMDLAKLMAYLVSLPCVTVPTSSATCAAVSSLSVLYDDDGRTVGTLCYDRAVASVVCDTGLLLRQPERLFAAGVLDAMAKRIEIDHYLLPGTTSDTGLSAAHALAGFSYERLGNAAFCTPETIYLTIPLTGIISGLSRGRNQSNLAHGLYEAVRRCFPSEAGGTLHGELVAIGLLLQLAFDGRHEKLPGIRAVMRRFSSPMNLSEAGIPDTAENRHILQEAMLHSPYFKDSPEGREALRNALPEVWK